MSEGDVVTGAKRSGNQAKREQDVLALGHAYAQAFDWPPQGFPGPTQLTRFPREPRRV